MNLITLDKLQELVDVFGPFGIGLSNNPFELVIEFSNSRMVNSPLFNHILDPHHIVISYEILREDESIGYMYLIKPKVQTN
jgi:hypothetical protein